MRDLCAAPLARMRLGDENKGGAVSIESHLGTGETPKNVKIVNGQQEAIIHATP